MFDNHTRVIAKKCETYAEWTSHKFAGRLRHMTAEQDRATALGNLIKQARTDAGLSVRKAAKAANLSEGRWRQLELGYQQVAGGVRVVARPRLDTISAIARALNTDELKLIDAAGIELSPGSRAVFGRSRIDPTIETAVAAMGIEELARKTERASTELAIYAKELSRRVHYQRVPDTTPTREQESRLAARYLAQLEQERSHATATTPADSTPVDVGRAEDFDLAAREGNDERPQHPEDPA